ncbi:13182_t:CDS:2 [Cetraspora pellucida]|uniref:13182_t:CDS:1 n=1 Tax=Cetraspora pellucida TaxID=1433469 RepID=A0ACA9N583_9GLOM|nr:13182_t:CDS:2 [Cetraspora pellucida]
MLIKSIQKITHDLHDLDINALQVVYSQLSRVLEDVRRPKRTFQVGDWH